MTELQTQQRLLYLEGYIRRLRASSLPPGGSTSQVLSKASGADNDVTWTSAGSGSGDMVLTWMGL